MGKLFAVILVVVTVVSSAIFISRVWWLPADVSVLGVGIDRQMAETMISAGVLFVVSQFVLALFVWQYGDKGDGRPIKIFPGGATPMVLGATLLVGAEIVVLSLVGTKVWAGIFLSAPDPNALRIDVQAEQFAFYFRYPGRDGTFGTMHPDLIDDGNNNFFGLDPANDTTARDDIVSASLVLPVNQPILLSLHAKDVGHAFYVPELRLQQDFIPGLVIPLHFTATKVVKKEIVCTQLCGLGHYNMRAYMDVMPEKQFAQWMVDQAAQQ
jgi:cytochrome c oxidase subunit 2